MENINLLNDEDLNALLYISGLSTKDDLDENVIDNCVNWLSDFTQNSNLNGKTNEFGNCELDKVPDSKISDKSIKHISINHEISTAVYNDILASLEATLFIDNTSVIEKVEIAEKNSTIRENNPKDYKSLNEELPINDFKYINVIHSKISNNQPKGFKSLSLNQQLSIVAKDTNISDNEEIICSQSQINSNKGMFIILCTRQFLDIP